jgi:heme/copper-type cytochrome/quinol oxidase subunit 2
MLCARKLEGGGSGCLWEVPVLNQSRYYINSAGLLLIFSFWGVIGLTVLCVWCVRELEDGV